MTTITFKNANGIAVTKEISNLNERLIELEVYELTRRRMSEADPNLMTSSSDITFGNELMAIRVLYEEQAKRNFVNEALANCCAEDRIEALEDISDIIDRNGAYTFAKEHNLMDLDNSAGTFMVQFMTAYNKEIYPKY